ncbi:MAG TPA: hypothetical protein VL132_03885 [Planctomycetaceae bacterium]|nr:hypothetical protein [Planctomycetaceae bacterium]
MTMKLSTVLLLVLCLGSGLPAQEAAPAKAADPPKPCEGTLKLDGKTYKLEHVLIYETKAFDEEAIAVLLSEKAIPIDKLKKSLTEGNGSDDSLFLFQPHVKVTFTPGGKSQFCNAWADNFSLSVSGTKLTGEFEIKEGRITGKTALANDDDGGSKGTFAATFSAPLLVFPRKAPPTKPAEPKPPGKPDEKPKAAAGEAINVHDLPLPKDATQVEYKKIVQQLTCRSATDHKGVAKFLTEQLAAQGWTAAGSDLVGPVSAILRRERGEAELTLFVKPDGTGSKVTVMTKGLSWEPKKPAPKEE